MSEEISEFDEKLIEEMNEKAIKNQFFTPDYAYIDLGLFKDIPIGCVYMEQIVLKKDENKFVEIQEKITDILPDYQTRMYDTVNPYFKDIGYTDTDIDDILAQERYHEYIFMCAPATKFLQTIIRHTLRNQNNSRPAEKYIKKSISDKHYTMEPIPVTYRINTYPLTLSTRLMEETGKLLGESLGVNITFMNKDPASFDESDWDEWMEKTDCFYLDSLGRFTKSPFSFKKQGDMQFAGVYFFVRKRFERCVMDIMRQEDVEHQIQMATAQLSMLCDFEWLQNNDVRLTDTPINFPVEDEEHSPTPT